MNRLLLLHLQHLLFLLEDLDLDKQNLLLVLDILLNLLDLFLLRHHLRRTCEFSKTLSSEPRAESARSRSWKSTTYLGQFGTDFGMLGLVAHEDHFLTVFTDVPFVVTLGGGRVSAGDCVALFKVHGALALLLVDELHQDRNVLRAVTGESHKVRACSGGEVDWPRNLWRSTQ